MSASLPSPPPPSGRRRAPDGPRVLPFPARAGAQARPRSSVSPVPAVAPREVRAIDVALPRDAVSPWAMTAWRLAAAVALVAPFALAPALPAGADADWARLMRGMALTKLALALPIVAAADWRVRRAGPCTIRVGWVATALVAACGPGWIWGLQGIGAASVAFHAALAAAVALLCVDGAAVGRARKRAGWDDGLR